MYALQAGRNSSLGTEPSSPPNAPESSSALVPASMPLPDTSTSATSRTLPSEKDTTKSPPNDEPPAGLSTSEDPHPSPSSGSLPWARMRSRSSSSIRSPRMPWRPSFSLVRDSTSAKIAVSTMVATIPAPALPSTTR